MKLFASRKKTGGRVRYSEDDYMYASAKLSALSRSLLSEDKLDALTEADGVGEVLERLAEYGIQTVYTDDVPDVERTLNGWLAEAYTGLASFCPDPEFLRAVRLRYDCHNVKTAIKCRYLGMDAAPFFIDCGCVPAAVIGEKVPAHDFSDLTDAMAKAADEADRALDGSGNARVVDTLLDRACYADMLTQASAVGFEAAPELVRLKIDLTNLMTSLRVGKIRNPEAAASLLADSVIEEGNIPADRFSRVCDADTTAQIAREGGYADLADAIVRAPRDASGLETVSRACDTVFLRRVRALTYMKALGAYPLLAYVIGLEFQVKNLRIILSGKEAGNDAQTIRERLRRYDV